MTAGEPVDWVRRGADPKHSTFLELFFDLVFVLALTQLSRSLIDDLSWTGALQTLLLVAAVWWTWVITTWVTDLYESRRPGLQVLVVTSMFGVLVMSTAVRHAFDRQGLVFAAGYVGIHLTRGLVLVPAARNQFVERRPLRILTWFVLSAPLWLTGAVLHGAGRLALWALALAVDYGAAALGWWVPRLGRSPDSEWNFGAEHIAERYRQIVIIGLGDTILVMGGTYIGQPTTPARAATLVMCFIITVLLWQIYFRFAAQFLASSLSAQPSPVQLARRAVYHHLLMVAGIVVTAAGNDIAIRDPRDVDRPGWVLPIVGGPALFLVGRIVFGREVLRHLSLSRLGGLAALLVLMPIALMMPPLATTATTAAILTGTLLPSLWRGRALKAREPGPGVAS